jgi:hypothetical protein
MATLDRTRLEQQPGKSGAYDGGNRMPLKDWEFDLGAGLLKSNGSLVSPTGRTTAMGGTSGVWQGTPESNKPIRPLRR